MKRSFFILLAIFLCLMTGCGKPVSLEDKYSFGTAYVEYADTTLALELPFELRKPDNAAEEAYAEKRYLTRFGANRHFLTLVEAYPAAELSAEAVMKETEETFTNPVLKEVQSSLTDTEAAGVPAKRMDVSYTQPMSDKDISLTGIIYIFEHEGIVWKVLYQYPSEDEDGTALAERVAGKLTFRE